MNTAYVTGNGNLLKATIKIIAGHEFRTPMNGIMGFAELLKHDSGSISQDNLHFYTSIILQSAKRLQSLSDRIGTWYWLCEKNVVEDKKFAISSKWVESLIEKHAECFLVDKNFFIYKSSIEDCLITGDELSIQAAINETVNNAFKFSKENCPVSVIINKQEDKLIINIRNHSNYATAEMLNSYTVFTQFNREKLEQQGLGLGLEIANLSMQGCNGKLKIESLNSAHEINIQLIFKI